MTITMKPVLALLALSAIGGCQTFKDALGQEVDPAYCAAHPANQVCKATYPDAGPTGCTSDDECASPTAVCETATGACVQCTPASPAACTGTTPVCGDDNACHGCGAHSECASAVCLPDGACASESDVAYVASNGTDNASCSQSEPCSKVASALATNRPYVKLSGVLDEGATVTVDNQTVTVLADPSAKLVRTSNGIVLEIKGTSQVAISDLEISGGSGPQGIGISLPAGNTATLALERSTIKGNTGGGIVATGGTVTISQSSISGNAGGGISITSSEFDITNTFIVGNGNPTVTQTYGGLQFNGINAGLRRFEFNTVTGNTAATNAATGAVCVLVNQPVTFSNNIVYGNQTSGTGTQVSAATSNCNWTYSDIGPDTASGANNLNADPLFIDAAGGDFHISATSPAKDAADPAATLATDFDGEQRPQGAARDIGADEAP